MANTSVKEAADLHSSLSPQILSGRGDKGKLLIHEVMMVIMMIFLPLISLLVSKQ